MDDKVPEDLDFGIDVQIPDNLIFLENPPTDENSLGDLNTTSIFHRNLVEPSDEITDVKDIVDLDDPPFSISQQDDYDNEEIARYAEDIVNKAIETHLKDEESNEFEQSQVSPKADATGDKSSSDDGFEYLNNEEGKLNSSDSLRVMEPIDESKGSSENVSVLPPEDTLPFEQENVNKTSNIPESYILENYAETTPKLDDYSSKPIEEDTVIKEVNNRSIKLESAISGSFSNYKDDDSEEEEQSQEDQFTNEAEAELKSLEDVIYEDHEVPVKQEENITIEPIKEEVVVKIDKNIKEESTPGYTEHKLKEESSDEEVNMPIEVEDKLKSEEHIKHEDITTEPLLSNVSSPKKCSNDDDKNFLMKLHSLVLWKNTFMSGGVFTCLLLLQIALLLDYSIISVLAYCGFLLLGANLACKVSTKFNLLKTCPFTSKMQGMEFDSRDIQHTIDHCLTLLEYGLDELKSIALFESFKRNIIAFIVFYSMTYIGAYFNLSSLIFLATIGLFVLPLVYDKYEREINKIMNDAKSSMNVKLESIKSRLPTLFG